MIRSLMESKEEKHFDLTVDIHSHLIPGIDDGSKSLDDSLVLLKAMEELGYQKVITTPHIMSDFYPNNPKKIREGLEVLRNAIKEVGLNIVIEAGAEYYLDDGFLENLKQGDMMKIGDDYLLCETSYLQKPLQFDEMVFQTTIAGFKMILAHPERYQYIIDFKKEYQDLKEKGIYFQVNINSFSGYYGKDAQKKALFLSEAGMIDFLGSDIHRLKEVETLKKVLNTNIIEKIAEKNKILNHTLKY
jgi:protein-tyrosine phosphatase